MRIRRQRYQVGSVRKVPRSHGSFAWEFRFYATDETGNRKLRVQTFDSAIYKTERDVRKAVEGQLASLNADTLGGKVVITFGQVMDRYISEELPTLKLSTQETNLGMIENHLRPRWGDEPLANVTALEVRRWLATLPVGASRKANARGAISRLLDLAMLWEYMPVVRNPMNLVKVKGSSKRVKSVTLLTPAMLKTIIKGLAAPYNLIVLVCGCLGLRISETLALKWEDFDWKAKQVLIRRAFTHGNIQESTKTDSSEADLPVFGLLAKSLHVWRDQQNPPSEWVFPSPATGGPMSASTMLSKHLKPAAAKAGIENVGFHDIRHSYKRWMQDADVSVGVMKDLLRHADIDTTMNVYGGKSISPGMRKGNRKVARKLF